MRASACPLSRFPAFPLACLLTYSLAGPQSARKPFRTSARSWRARLLVMLFISAIAVVWPPAHAPPSLSWPAPKPRRSAARPLGRPATWLPGDEVRRAQPSSLGRAHVQVARRPCFVVLAAARASSDRRTACARSSCRWIGGQIFAQSSSGLDWASSKQSPSGRSGRTAQELARFSLKLVRPLSLVGANSPARQKDERETGGQRRHRARV